MSEGTPIPVCCHCKLSVVENIVEHKKFWYCRRCKIEVDNTGWEVGMFRIDESTKDGSYNDDLDLDFDEFAEILL